MKKQEILVKKLCRNFCPYYKPGKNEKLACRGFVVVQGLIKRGGEVPLEKPEKIVMPDAAGMDTLRQQVCEACSFSKADCDFILSKGKASPCGGFILLSHLLGSGTITIEEIK